MRWILLVARVISAAGALASAYGYIDSRLLDERALIGPFTVSDHFLGVAYVFGFALGALMAVALCWEGVSKWEPISGLLFDKRKRFGELYPEIVQRRDNLIASVEERGIPETSLSYQAKMMELITSLHRLRIPFPKSIPNIEDLAADMDTTKEWYGFLMRLAARSREKDLKGAQGIMKRMADATENSF